MPRTLLSLPESFAESVGRARLQTPRPAGALPASILEDEVFLGSDPAGRNVGSGGGTVHLLHEAWKRERDAGKTEAGFLEWVTSGSRLVLHAGGQSRRLPAYAPLGKVFIPMPLREEMPSARFQQTLGDLQVPLYQTALREAGPGACVLLASGDVWLDFDPTSLPPVSFDLTGVGMRVSAEMASEFGVFFVRRADTGACAPVERFLQKPSPEQIRALQREGFEFWVDTGLWFLGSRAITALAGECGWNDAAGGFNGPDGGVQPLDFYADWAPRVVGELSTGLIPLSDANFYHLGATRQMFETLDALQQSRTRFRKSCYNSFAHTIYTGVSSRERPVWLDTVGQNPMPALVGQNVVTLLPAGASVRELPQEICIDCVPVAGGGFALRVYRLGDSGKGAVGEGATVVGRDAAAWLAARGDEAEIGADIADVPLYPVLPAEGITQAWVDWFLGDQPDPTLSAEWRAARRLTARQLLSFVDGAGVIEAKAAGAVASFESMLERMSQREEPSLMRFDFAHLAAVAHANPALTASAGAASQKIWDQLQSPLFKARWAMFADALALDPLVPGKSNRRAAFDTLAEAVVANHTEVPAAPELVLKPDQIVWARCPVRLDLAGGWTDTPPYCFEEGGAVVNVAVDLNGQPPIQVFIRRTVEPRIRIRSIDLGVAETVTTCEELGGYRDARSGFSLPKAALCLAGLHPDFNAAGQVSTSLEETLKAMGGGLEVSLLCAVPKGSGLGTSSVLAATLLGAISRALNLGWDKIEIYRRVLAIEQLLGTGGGWQDQAGGLFPGLKLVSTEPGFGQLPVIRYLPTDLFEGEIAAGKLLLYYTGITRLAKDILSQIVTHMFLRECGVRDTLLGIHRNAARMFDALQRGDEAAWVRCLARSWRLNGELDPGCNPDSTQAIIDGMGADFAAGKLLGAGGGGYLLIRAASREAAERIRARLEAEPPNEKARFVDLSVSKHGLQVTTS